AVSDKSGGLHRPQGLDIGDVLKWVRERRQLAGYPQADAIPNDQVLTLDCDVVVPAATENVITRKNAPHIKAKIICEGANGPTTAAADEILEKKGIFVIPDILANAGGVTVSYFEWVQDRGGYFWDEETVNRRLESIMVRSFSEVVTWAVRPIGGLDGPLGAGRTRRDLCAGRRRRPAGAGAARGRADLEPVTPHVATRAGARRAVRAAVSRVHDPSRGAVSSRTLS